MLESMSDLLTTGEAARVLEVSESTIRLWDRNGRLTARRTAGGQRVFDATVVQALAEARQRLLGVALGLLHGVVGDVVAMGLQLRDGGLQLGDRGADVGQLDDVRHWCPGQRSQPGQLVRDLLVLPQPVGERRDDPACQGDVVRVKLHPGAPGVRSHDGQQRTGRQRWRFVDLRPDDLGR
ncbi:MAG TPA: MerR family DNA-binding transcriptional regulator [Acidobacteria bacterium]|nr:MerR family DNA-binding transcriptional regulator [Acidobacteriota bacterium]HIN10608.1 MerR family DNA-binding transcriptional regulator [Acidobacteriota bacterium]